MNKILNDLKNDKTDILLSIICMSITYLCVLLIKNLLISFLIVAIFINSFLMFNYFYQNNNKNIKVIKEIVDKTIVEPLKLYFFENKDNLRNIKKEEMLRLFDFFENNFNYKFEIYRNNIYITLPKDFFEIYKNILKNEVYFNLNVELLNNETIRNILRNELYSNFNIELLNNETIRIIKADKKLTNSLNIRNEIQNYFNVSNFSFCIAILLSCFYIYSFNILTLVCFWLLLGYFCTFSYIIDINVLSKRHFYKRFKY